MLNQQTTPLDLTFHALADPTRRAMVDRELAKVVELLADGQAGGAAVEAGATTSGAAR